MTCARTFVRLNTQVPPETILVFFDYLCPYAWRGAELVERVAGPLGLRFDFVHFSLYQANTKDEGWQLWNERHDPQDPAGSWGLLPFLASIAARQQGREAHDRFRLELLRRRHRDHAPFTPATVMEAAEAAGLHLASLERELANPEARTTLAREHHQAVHEGVFGTPTFKWPDGPTAYVRLKELPQGEQEAADLFTRLQGMLHDHPYLETVRQPRQEGN